MDLKIVMPIENASSKHVNEKTVLKIAMRLSLVGWIQGGDKLDLEWKQRKGLLGWDELNPQIPPLLASQSLQRVK